MTDDTNSTASAQTNYIIISQSRDEVALVDNSPSVSMWPYLLRTERPRLLNSLSVYTDRGTTRERTRLLYMNSGALKLWHEMGHSTTVIGESHRPPRSATLSFGMPFSE